LLLVRNLLLLKPLVQVAVVVVVQETRVLHRAVAVVVAVVRRGKELCLLHPKLVQRQQ
jgi:hypothetical protein